MAIDTSDVSMLADLLLSRMFKSMPLRDPHTHTSNQSGEQLLQGLYPVAASVMHIAQPFPLMPYPQWYHRPRHATLVLIPIPESAPTDESSNLLFTIASLPSQQQIFELGSRNSTTPRKCIRLSDETGRRTFSVQHGQFVVIRTGMFRAALENIGHSTRILVVIACDTTNDQADTDLSDTRQLQLDTVFVALDLLQEHHCRTEEYTKNIGNPGEQLSDEQVRILEKKEPISDNVDDIRVDPQTVWKRFTCRSNNAINIESSDDQVM